MPPQVTVAKGDHGPGAINYNALFPLDFDLVTLSSNQTTGTVANAQPLGLSIKIFALSVVMSTVNGTAPVAVNICSGIGPQGGVAPTDPLLIGGVPPAVNQMAENGNILFAADQQLNGSSAPVVNTCYVLYPVNGLWDIIWPDGSLLTLRVSAGASAASGVLKAIAWGVAYDTNPTLPNQANPFAPSAAML